jgi:hypothetical protein
MTDAGAATATAHDAHLLAAYARDRDHAAFATLVHRHADLFTAYGVLDVPVARVIDPSGNVVFAGPLAAVAAARKYLPAALSGL